MINRSFVRYGVLSAAILALSGCGSSAEKEQKYLQKAQESFKAENYDKSRVEIKNVLQINPKNADALYLMAELAEKDKDWRKMYGLLNTVVTEKPDFTEAQLKLGKLMLLGGDAEKALEKAALILAKAPDNKDALLLKAAVNLRNKDVLAAKELLTKVLSLSPGDVEATFLLTKLYGEEKRYPEVLQLVDAALAVHPEEVNLALVKMQVLMSTGKVNESDAMVAELINRFPEQNSVYYSMAKYYVAQQKPELAEKVLRDLIAKKPTDVESKMALVEFFLSQKNPLKAEQTLQEFVQSNPDAYEFKFALVNLYKDKPTQAIDLLNQIIAKAVEGPNALKAKNMLAKYLFAQGDKAKAEQLIEEVVKEDAHNADALMMRSTLYVDKGKYEAAIGDLRTVLRDQPDSEKAYILSARTHLKSGYLDLAQESLQSSLSINPANLEVRKDLARLLMMKRDSEGAIKVLEELGDAKLQNADVLAMLADLYAQKGDWTKAEAAANAIAKVNNTGLAPFKLAQVYAAQQKFPAAVERYQEVLKLKPMALDVLAGLANTYMAMGDTAKAGSLLSKALAVEPGNVGLLNMKGLFHQKQKQFADAEKSFLMVINQAKNQETGYINLAGVYLAQNQPDKAIDALKQGLAALPQNLNVMQNIAVIYEKTARPEEAITLYRDILKIAPDNKNALNNIAAITANITSDKARLEEALSLVKGFKDEKAPEFLDTYAWVNYLNGQYDEALSAMEKVVKLVPNFPEFNYHLGMAYAAKGRNEEAKMALQKALPKDIKAPWVSKAQAKLDELNGK